MIRRAGHRTGQESVSMKNFKAGTVTRPTEKLNMRTAIGGQKGFTLIEIVMVIVILGVIGAFTFQFVAHGVQAFKKSSARKDLYDQGRLALERMVRELRDTKEVTGSSGSSITFKKAHPAQAADNTEEVKFQLNGTSLERVGDPNGTPATAVLASNVSSFTVTGVGAAGGGGGLCAITYDSVSSGTASYTTTETFSHTIGSGTNRVLVVGVTFEDCDDYPSVTGITYNGQPLTPIDSGQVISGNGCGGRAELRYLLEADLPSAGAYNVVVSTSGTFDELVAGAISLENVAQQAPEASNSNSNDAQTTISTNITTITDGAWLVDVVHSGNETGDFVPNSGQTQRYQQVSGSGTGAGSTKPIATAGVTSAGWTSAGANRLAHVVAAFAPATGCGGGGGTIDQRISFDEDDSEEYISSGSLDWGSSDLELGEEGSAQIVGMRWRNITIPQGVTITSAYIEFTADENQAGTPVNLTFRGEAADNAAVFENAVDNISDRTPTSASVSWNDVPAWSTDETHQSTDISPIIQEIVNLPGWASGNALVVLVTGSGRRTAESHDGDRPLMAPLLYVTTGGNLATLEITLSSVEGGTVSMRTMVYLRNVP
jgi:prepilin-type N-terminal cleavage/methylation domain-containing protein